MRYVIVLTSKGPYIEKKDSWKSFQDVAKEHIRRGNEDADLEQVFPRIFKGEYGFLMDDYAVQYQTEINPIATCLYNYPDDPADGWHPILGAAVIGKSVPCEGGGYELDGLDPEDEQRVMEAIYRARDFAQTHFQP